MNKIDIQIEVLKAIADFSSDWLMLIDVDLSIKYISPSVKAITGYEQEDFFKDKDFLKTIIYPEDRERIVKEFKEGVRSPHSRAIQFRIVHKDGTVHWIDHHSSPIFDDKKNVIARVSSNRNITIQNETEASLKSGEAFFRRILNGIQNPMCVIDKNYRILFANKKVHELYNRENNDILGKFCYEVYNGRSEYCEQCAARKVFETGKQHSLIKKEVIDDGSTRYLERYALPLSYEGGMVTQAIVIVRDITDRELAVNCKLKMGRLIEQSTEVVVITDTDGNIEYVNSAFEKVTGYSFNEVKGKNPNVLKSGFLPTDFYKEIWDRLIKGDIWHGVFINKKKNGNNYYEEATIFPIKNNSGKIVNYAKVSRDITKQKELEDSLRQKEENLRALINATPDIICFKDGQGRWLEANEADLKLFQLENVDYRGKKDSELAKYSPFYYNAFMTCEDSDEKTWQRGTLSRGIEIIPVPGGEDRVYDVIKVPLFEKDGLRKGLVVLGRDITEMKKAQEALKQSELKNRAILQALPDILFVINNELQFIDVYAQQESKLLISKEKIIGANIYDILPEYLARLTEQNITKTLRKKSLQVFEYKLEIEGKERWFEARMVYKNENEVLAINYT